MFNIQQFKAKQYKIVKLVLAQKTAGAVMLQQTLKLQKRRTSLISEMLLFTNSQLCPFHQPGTGR